MILRARTRLLAAALVLAAIGFAFAFVPPSGPRSLQHFEPSRTAQLEGRLWQAYYQRERVEMFRLLTILLREQYRYSWARAAQGAFYFARAAATFAERRDDYDRVLPDLTRAYELARQWTDARFEPSSVARAELAWWVARRTKGEQRVDQVGARIAEEYALIYGVPQARVARAGLLRAQAGALRDAAGERADWTAIGRLLDESYRSLHAAVQPVP
jgi:hypothetical protein